MRFPKWKFGMALAMAATLLPGSLFAAGAGDLRDGPVKRGTKLEELKAKMGEPKSIKASEGTGVRVERWFYADGVVVVVQNGFVIESFVEGK